MEIFRTKSGKKALEGAKKEQECFCYILTCCEIKKHFLSLHHRTGGIACIR